MTQRATTSKTKAIVGLLAAATAAGAFAAAALGSAPTAKADCASFFGIGNSAHCQSNPTSIAIAIGPNATAIASGLFGAAFAIGQAPVSMTPGNAGVARATSTGAFTFANAAGDNVTANAGGIYGIAMQWGYGGRTVTSGVANVAQGWTNPFGSTSSTGFATTVASGFGNAITNGSMVDGPGYSGEAVGIGNYAFNGWGFDTVLQAGGTSTSLFNVAFTLFGSGVVKAGPGPFAIAGTIGQQTGQTIQVGPGINITRGGQIGFGGTAAAPAHTSAVAHAKKAAAVPTVVKSAAVNSKKAGASAAAGSSRKKK